MRACRAAPRPASALLQLALFHVEPLLGRERAVEVIGRLGRRQDHLGAGTQDRRQRLVAVGLAERLDFVTSYLSDLKHQYGDAPGLAMVSDVLKQLALRQAPLARPGSARDPDPDY